MRPLPNSLPAGRGGGVQPLPGDELAKPLLGEDPMMSLLGDGRVFESLMLLVADVATTVALLEAVESNVKILEADVTGAEVLLLLLLVTDVSFEPNSSARRRRSGTAYSRPKRGRRTLVVGLGESRSTLFTGR